MRRPNLGAIARLREHVHGESVVAQAPLPERFRPKKRGRGQTAPESVPAGQSAAANSIDAFVATAPGKKAKKSKSPAASRTRAQDELERLMNPTLQPSGFKAQHFVALYEKLHVHCYKVGPAELETPEWWAALNAANRMLTKDFADDPAGMIDFVRWTWARERARVKKADGEVGRRLLWRWQFGPSMLTDYRVATRA